MTAAWQGSSDLPMFPLGSVFLPGSIVPLHVFEPRYRLMMDLVLAGDQRFGLALITRGREAGGGDLRARVGVAAELTAHEVLDDDRRFVQAIVHDRVRIDAWLPDDPHPRAVVETWPDPPSSVPVGDVVAGVLDALDALVAAVGDPPGMRQWVHDLFVGVADGAEAVWRGAQVGDLGALDQQRLLEAPDNDARLPLLLELLADRRDVLAFQRGSPG